MGTETPPHHPRYGIRMDIDEIRHVLNEADGRLQLLNAEELSPGRSYNNRIYFLKVCPDTRNTEVQELVLKINGRFWGPEKIENEVSCLQLLQTYCPEVPSPRVIAWTGSNNTIGASSGVKAGPPSATNNEKLWILMTRVPGEPIDTLGLNEEVTAELTRQLAKHVTGWRTLIPLQQFCGGLSFATTAPTSTVDLKIPGGQAGKDLDCKIRGLLGDNVKWQEGVSTTSHYYRLRLEDKIERLSQSSNKDADAALLNDLRDFVQRDVLYLFGDLSPELFVFTHYDLSPRNILVSGNPPQITGIVDFEFAGFYSPLEEFLNDLIGNEGNWSKSAYNAYLEQLRENGIATPEYGFDKGLWEQSVCMEKLVQNIAPWWLPGDYSGDELQAGLAKTRSVVKKMLAALRQSARR